MARTEVDMASGRFRHRRTDAILGAAALSSIVFILLIAVPALGVRRPVHHGHLPLLLMHIGGGTLMLLAGVAALRVGLTKQWFRWHRWIGFTYLAGGTVASVSAFIRSFDTRHTPGVSTATLSIVWLAFTAMAWRAIRNRQMDQHREWMIRSYVVAWTFVFCRFYTRAIPATYQGQEIDMIWLNWIGPVLLCEILLQWRRGAARRPERDPPRQG